MEDAFEHKNLVEGVDVEPGMVIFELLTNHTQCKICLKPSHPEFGMHIH